MNSWQDSPNIIIILYRRFASGKFISNILSFNDHFCPQICLDVGVKRWHNSVLCLDQVQTFDHAFLRQRKIQEIFNTIPPTRDLWTEWLEYELGCNMFWGSYGSNFDLEKVRPAVVNILQQGYRCFLMCHSFNELKKYLGLFPNAQCVQVINDREVVTKNLLLKVGPDSNVSKIELCENNDLTKFDIGTIFEKTGFFHEIDVLLEKLGIEDKTLNLQVYQYYRQYTAFY